MIKIVAATAALTITLAAGQAMAANELEPRTSVPVAGIDFSNPAQAKLTYMRLKKAADAACDSDSANPRVVQDDIRCSRAALAKAVAQLDRPTVTAMHQQDDNARGASAFAAADQ